MKIVTNILLFIIAGLLNLKQLDAAGGFPALHPNNLVVTMKDDSIIYGIVENCSTIPFWLDPKECSPKAPFSFIPIESDNYLGSVLRPQNGVLRDHYSAEDGPSYAHLRLGDNLYFSTISFIYLELSPEIYASPPKGNVYITLPGCVYFAELVPELDPSPCETVKGSEPSNKRQKLDN